MESWTDRLHLMVGEAGLERLASARVVVFGVGGVGSNCAEALVRGGIGNLVFVDGDAVQPSNINRQAVAYPQTIGRRKVEVMRHLAEAINPEVRVQALDMFVTCENVEEVFRRIIDADDRSCVLFDSVGTDGAAANASAADVAAVDTAAFDAAADEVLVEDADVKTIERGVGTGRIDFVVDAIDTVSSKLAIIEAAQKRGIPVISSMGGANKSDPTQFRFSDIYDTSVCPLAKAVRKLAREAGLEGFPVLYSREAPRRVDKSGTDGTSVSSGRILGTMSYIPPIMGYMIAGYVIEHLLANSQS